MRSSKDIEKKIEFEIKRKDERRLKGDWRLQELIGKADVGKAVDSKSYDEFKFSVEEESQLAKQKEELMQIAQQINELGKRQEAVLEAQKQNKMIIADDPALQMLLSKQFPEYKDLICQVNREHALCIVTVQGGDFQGQKEKELKAKFNPFFKSKYTVTSEVFTHSFLGGNRTHVVFHLSDRDNLINGLQQKPSSTISSATSVSPSMLRI